MRLIFSTLFFLLSSVLTASRQRVGGAHSQNTAKEVSLGASSGVNNLPPTTSQDSSSHLIEPEDWELDIPDIEEEEKVLEEGNPLEGMEGQMRFFSFEPVVTRGMSFHEQMLNQVIQQRVLTAQYLHENEIAQAYLSQVVQRPPPPLNIPHPAFHLFDFSRPESKSISRLFIIGDFDCNMKDSYICYGNSLMFFLSPTAVRLSYLVSSTAPSLAMKLDRKAGRFLANNIDNTPFVVVTFRYNHDLLRFVPVISSDIHSIKESTYKSGDVIAIIPRSDIWNLVNFYALILPTKDRLDDFGKSLFAHMTIKMGLVLYIE